MDKKVGVYYPDLGSFFVAFGIYLIIIILLIYKISTTDFKGSPSYTDDQNAFMDVYVMDIDDSLIAKSPKFSQKQNDINLKTDKKSDKQEIKTSTKEIKEVKPKEQVKESKEEIKEPVKEEPKKVEKEPVKELIPDENAKEVKKETPKEKSPSLSDLFASSTKDNKNLQDSKKQEDAAINSRKKSAKENAGVNSTKTAYQISKIQGDASGHSMKTGIYNEFFGKLEKQLVVLWNTYTSLGGNDATVEITIDKNGRLAGYRILELSYNDDFNQKVRDFEAVLERAQFPIPPNGQNFTHKYKLKDLLN